jgi:hypothetical protein
MKRDIASLMRDEHLVREMTRAVPGVDRAGLLAAIFDEWGGMSRFARDLVMEFHAAKPGSLSRQRLLDCVCRLINWESKDTPRKPVEEMTDEELDDTIKYYLLRLEGSPGAS